jgi:hypothetical protein
MSGEVKPWDKLPDENFTWYGRFTAWLHQAKPRSVLKVYREERERKGVKRSEKKVPRTLPQSWAEAKERFRWQDRANDWDAAEQERLDRELAEKRKEVLADLVKLGEEMRARARAIMALPLLNEVVKRDRDGNEIEWLLVPEFRAHVAGVNYAKEAKSHALRGLGLPEKITEQRLTGKGGGPMEVNNVDGLSETERFERLLAKAQSIGKS